MKMNENHVIFYWGATYENERKPCDFFIEEQHKKMNENHVIFFDFVFFIYVQIYSVELYIATKCLVSLIIWMVCLCPHSINN